MRFRHFKLISFLLITSGFSGALSQNIHQTLNATGGSFQTSGGSISFSAGQLVCNVYSAVNGYLSQGVQQPYEISVLTDIRETEKKSPFCSVFPNPANSHIIVNIVAEKSFEKPNLTYQLWDSGGMMKLTDRLMIPETIINLYDLVPSVYFLKILDTQGEIIIYKIIKN